MLEWMGKQMFSEFRFFELLEFIPFPPVLLKHCAGGGEGPEM
jgi:hypothetical protein